MGLFVEIIGKRSREFTHHAGVRGHDFAGVSVRLYDHSVWKGFERVGVDNANGVAFFNSQREPGFPCWRFLPLQKLQHFIKGVVTR